MKHKISIIIPIYNVEKYINKCIDSIINQSYTNLEIILVNDGSPDRSPQICEEYAKKDKRIKVIHKENGGLSDARNAGLLIATGDYIIFIDSDDYVEFDMVERAVNIAVKQEVDAVIWGYYADYLDRNDVITKTVTRIPVSGIFDRNNKENIHVSIEQIGLLGYAWNKMYKLDFIRMNNYKFTKGLSLVEDIVFNSPVLANTNKIAFIDAPFNHYIQRDRDTLGNKFYDNYFELKKQALIAIKNLLTTWNIENRKINSLLGAIGLRNLKTVIRSLTLEDNFSLQEKKLHLKALFSDEVTIEILKEAKVSSFKDKLIKALIKFKQINAILYIYKKFN
ncbi:glycosyltransferase [Bacillus infantis]|uniref:glycosyltransferase n=1 Tax=Bacillus infantis TaxID=324767 RepID=UPI00344FF036